MYDFAFHHIRKAQNVGDKNCSPRPYFDFGENTVSCDLNDKKPDSHSHIFGGGFIFNYLVKHAASSIAPNQKLFVWGVGVVNLPPSPLGLYDFVERATLISTRDYTFKDLFEYVPCASAMSKCFDNPPEPEHDLVLFLHKDKTPNIEIPKGIPVMTNQEQDFRKVIDFIASGRTVLSSSYHGTLWAMLLGRKVACLPFNDKFKTFREKPLYVKPENWLRRSERQAYSFDGLLEENRALNHAFYEKVMNEI